MEIIILIKYIIIATTLIAMHELGHYLTAKYFGFELKFYFSIGKLFKFIPMPRLIWNMPNSATIKQQRIISIAGFITEYIYANIGFFFFGYLSYLVFFIIHMFLYKFYAGDYSDYKYFK